MNSDKRKQIEDLESELKETLESCYPPGDVEEEDFDGGTGKAS